MLRIRSRSSRPRQLRRAQDRHRSDRQRNNSSASRNSVENVAGNDVYAFDEIKEKLYRQNILDTGRRVDGRGAEDLRTISCDSGVLPAYDIAVSTAAKPKPFITTLGTSRDQQDVTASPEATSKSFILHYNFPPFSTGETDASASPDAEIGHGACRALPSSDPSSGR